MPRTLAQNAQYIAETIKPAIKAAIEAQGVTVPSTDSFLDYADRIGEIEGGGGGSAIDTSKVDYSIGSNPYPLLNDGRYISGFKSMSGYGVFPRDASGNWLDVDWSESFEIGIAFKYTVADTNQTLFGSGISGAQYYKSPMIMLHPDSQQFEIDISTTGNSWDMTMSQTVTYASLTVNTWYFLKMTFKQSDMSLVVQVSDDFSTWDTLLSITMSAAYYHDAASLYFGGFVQNSAFSSNNLLIDTYNTYVKDSTGSIVWGCFEGQGAEYELYDYIESDGTQCIDLGVKLNASDVVKCMYVPLSGMTNWNWLWIAEDTNASKFSGVVFMSSSQIADYDYSVESNRRSWTANQISESSLTASAAINANVKFSDDAIVKLYSFSINNNYFLPCRRKSDGAFGLWDVANQAFLGDSAGGNAFVGGSKIMDL